VKQVTKGTRDPQVIAVLDSGSHINVPDNPRAAGRLMLIWPRRSMRRPSGSFGC